MYFLIYLMSKVFTKGTGSQKRTPGLQPEAQSQLIGFALATSEQSMEDVVGRLESHGWKGSNLDEARKIVDLSREALELTEQEPTDPDKADTILRAHYVQNYRQGGGNFQILERDNELIDTVLSRSREKLGLPPLSHDDRRESDTVDSAKKQEIERREKKINALNDLRNNHSELDDMRCHTSGYSLNNYLGSVAECLGEYRENFTVDSSTTVEGSGLEKVTYSNPELKGVTAFFKEGSLHHLDFKAPWLRKIAGVGIDRVVVGASCSPNGATSYRMESIDKLFEKDESVAIDTASELHGVLEKVKSEGLGSLGPEERKLYAAVGVLLNLNGLTVQETFDEGQLPDYTMSKAAEFSGGNGIKRLCVAYPEGISEKDAWRVNYGGYKLGVDRLSADNYDQAREYLNGVIGQVNQ